MPGAPDHLYGYDQLSDRGAAVTRLAGAGRGPLQQVGDGIGQTGQDRAC